MVTRSTTSTKKVETDIEEGSKIYVTGSRGDGKYASVMVRESAWTNWAQGWPVGIATHQMQRLDINPRHCRHRQLTNPVQLHTSVTWGLDNMFDFAEIRTEGGLFVCRP